MRDKLGFLLKRNNVLIVPAIFWGMSMLSNVFNWLFNIQAGRILTKEEFSVLTVFLSFQYILSVPANALKTTVSRFTAYYTEKGEQEKHFYFFRQYWWLSWALGLLCLSIFLIFYSFITSFFGLDSSSSLLLIFTLLFIPLFLISFEIGTLSGQLAFIWVGILFLIESVVKLTLLSISNFFPISPLTASVLALPISVFAAWVIAILVARSFHPLPVIVSLEENKKLKDAYTFLGNSVFAGLGAVLLYNVDVLLVKHFFSASEAGVYATLSLLGKTLYFGAGSLIGIIIPLTAQAQAKNKSARLSFFILLGLITVIGMSILLSYLLIPEFVITMLLTERGLVVLPYLSTYSLGMFFLVLIACFTTYSLAKKNYLPVRLTLLAAIIETMLIFIFHESLGQVVTLVTGTLFFLLLFVIMIEIFGITTEVVLNNFKSFFTLFARESLGFVPIKSESSINKKINVLIFNWRDVKHREAGGSEVYLHEIGKRLAKSQYNVVLFTANDGKSLPREKYEGIQIIRRGGFITVYFWAVLYYFFRLRKKVDIILDSENGIPFFTPLFVRKPVILVVHHVHQDIFFKSLIPPFSWIANFLETYFMPWVYKKSCVVSVSKSTAQDLLKEIDLATTFIISNGVDLKKYRLTKKSPIPLISYVGRLKKYKSIDVLLLAFKHILKRHSNAQLIIAGDGDYRLSLEEKAQDLGINHQVKFLGKVSEEEKINLLGKSWVMVQPSFLEGWGITCIEANACGTPVLASRVSGLKDAVSEGVSGYLFSYGDNQELTRKVCDLINDQETRNKLSLSAREWSKQYSWTKQSEKFSFLLDKLLGESLSQSCLLEYENNVSLTLNVPKTAVSIVSEINVKTI